MLIVVSTIFAISACGRGRNDEYNGEPTGEAKVEVLSMFIPDGRFQDPLRIAERTLNQELYEHGRAFELEINTFPLEDIQGQISRMETLMMAGHMYDIFHMLSQPNFWRYSQSGFIADIYTLIDACMHTNREDFFTNAFDIFTINEGLYAFPLEFSFHQFAINSTLPQEFINMFSARDAITHTEVMSMYLNLQQIDNNDFNSLAIANFTSGLFPTHILTLGVNDFIDFSERMSHLNSNGFIAFLDNIKRVNTMQGFDITAHWTDFSGRSERVRESQQFMIICDNFLRNSLYVFFEPSVSYFLHHTPLSNNNGELHVNRYMLNPVYIISSSGNESLAWDFLRHLIAPASIFNDDHRTWAMGNISIPIKRSYLEASFLAQLDNSSSWLSRYFVGMREADTERDERIQQALDRLIALTEMPVATIPLVPISIIEDDLSLLLDGIITAEDAALRMHNRISLWLIE